MSNKINGLELRPVRVSAGTAVRKSGDTAGGNSDSAGSPDVQITTTARSIAALEQAVQDLPAIDSAKVEEIQQRLASGRYQIDPQRIADGLLRREDELTGLARK